MSHLKKVITKEKLRYAEQKEQKQTMVEFASTAVRYWYRSNERVKKLHTIFIQPRMQNLIEIETGKISFIRWLTFSPFSWIRKIGIKILDKNGSFSNQFDVQVRTYQHEYNKWQIEAIMGGQVKLSPTQIAVVIGISEDEVRSMVQELAKEIEDFENKSKTELEKRSIIKDRIVNTQKE